MDTIEHFEQLLQEMQKIQDKVEWLIAENDRLRQESDQKQERIAELEHKEAQ